MKIMIVTSSTDLYEAVINKIETAAARYLEDILAPLDDTEFSDLCHSLLKEPNRLLVVTIENDKFTATVLHRKSPEGIDKLVMH